jgi:hypothetical protein
MLLFFRNGYLSLKFENFAVLSKTIHYYIIGCRKNILSICVALLTFYKFIIKKKKKKISHFKMPILNSDVTVNSYNNFYLFSMKDKIMIIYNKLPFLACKNILIIIYDLSNILEWYNTF